MKSYEEMAKEVFRRRDEYAVSSKRKRRKTASAIISVCLALALTGSAFFVFFGSSEEQPGDETSSNSPAFVPTPKPDGLTDFALSAQSVADLFVELPTMGGGTTEYKMFSTTQKVETDLSLLPVSGKLPIYQYKRSRLPIDETEFLPYANNMLSSISDMLNVSFPDSPVIKRDDGSLYMTLDSDKQSDSEYWGMINCYPTYCSVNINGNSSPGTEARVHLDGEPLKIPARSTDTQILSSLSGASAKLFTMFNTSFRDAKIVRGREEIVIYYYNRDGHEMNGFSSSYPYSDYIRITFRDDSDYLSPANYFLSKCSIEYFDYRDDSQNKLGILYEEDVISLEEAEELLFNGYVFGGQYLCPSCEKPIKAVDFSEYDAVTLVYYFNFNYTFDEPRLGVPFYRFYKLTSETNGSYTYAATYVPAIKVADIEEYFEEKAASHGHS